MAELSNDEANDLADEILLRSEFLPAREPGFFSRAVNRVVDEIAELLSRIFGAIFGGSGGGAGSVFAIILLVVAAVVLVLAIAKALRERVAKSSADDSPGTRIVFDEIVEPEALRAELARHRAAGDWRAAVIAAFRLGVIGLIEENIAREVPGATTGDFATAVQRRRPALLGTYEAAASSFDRAFYSDLDVTNDDMTTVDELLAALRGPELSLAGA